MIQNYITVKDCLGLPALKEAKLIAGANGVNRPVSSVSVLEWPSVEVLSRDVLIGNEVVISGLIQIKDDVKKQCDLIRHLCSMGTACLIIYYVGIFMPDVDDELIKTAEEIDYPLIVMPYGRIDFRYSDIITNITEHIHTQRLEGNYYLTDVVKSITVLESQKKTIKGVLRLLADRLRCTLLLVDKNMEKRGSAAWPLSHRWDYENVLRLLENSKCINTEDRENIDGHEVKVWACDINMQSDKEMKLFAMEEGEYLNGEIMQQASDVIALILSIWNRGSKYDRPDDFIGAVLNDDPVALHKIALHMKVSIEVVTTMWIFDIRYADEKERGEFIKCATRILQEYYKIAIVSIYDSYIVAFTDEPIFEISAEEIGNEIVVRMAKEYEQIKLFIMEDMHNTERARKTYISVVENMQNVYEAFPRRQVYNESDIRFIKGCLSYVNQGEEKVGEAMYSIKKLLEDTDSTILMKTLCVYLLDAELNMQKTGEFLYLHKNTVNYRLNKIKNIIKCDLSQMPATLDIYHAAAIYRLLREEKDL